MEAGRRARIRMKWKQWGQTVLATAVAIGAGTGLVSCGTSNTIDYLYATSAKNNPGQINVFRVDSQSGALTQIPDSPYTAGRNPVSLVIDGSGKNLYVANHDDNSIVQYAIGTDAKLYGQHTINPPGTEPVWLAIHSYYDSSGTLLGSLLLVVETFQPNFSVNNTSPGALFVYQLDRSGTLSSTPVTQTVAGAASGFLPLGNAPTGATFDASGDFAYVTDILSAGQTGSGNGTCGAGQGGVQGYSIAFDGSTLPSGVLTPVPNSPFCAGTTPSAIASHPIGSFLYVTDSSQNQVIAYGINTTTAPGALTTLPNTVVAAGVSPSGVTVEPRGMYAYVTNRSSATVNGYAINQATGALSAIASSTGGTGGGTTQAQPTCIIVEPALGRFAYTSDFVDGTINGFSLDPNTGALSATQGGYYNGSGLATCVAATSHGNHPIIHGQTTAG